MSSRIGNYNKRKKYDKEEIEYLKKRIQELYIDYKMKKSEVIHELGISESSFDEIRFLVDVKKIKSGRGVVKIDNSLYETIYDMNRNKKISMPKIAKMYNVNLRTIQRIIAKIRMEKT